MSRTTILIISAAVAILVIGGIAFFLLRQLAAPTPGGTTPTSIFGRLPIIGSRVGPSAPPESGAPSAGGVAPPASEEVLTRRALQLTAEAVVGPVFNEKSQKIFYYKKSDGHLVSNNPAGGREETISNLTILNILEVRWSPDAKKAIVLYQDGNEVKKFITEATSSPKVAFLPTAATSPVWAGDGKSVWWLAKDNQTYTLVSADVNGKNQRKRGLVTPIPELALSVASPDTVMLVPKTASFFDTPLFLFSLRTLTLNPLFTGFGLTTLSDPNPKLQHIAYTTTSRTGALDTLHILDLKSGKDTSWPLKTLVAKCIFSADSKLLFCAVPKAPPERDLPEAWFAGKISFSDSIYKIDLGSGKAEEIFREGEYDITSLVVSTNAKKLFFIDKKTGFLYGLSLE